MGWGWTVAAITGFLAFLITKIKGAGASEVRRGPVTEVEIPKEMEKALEERANEELPPIIKSPIAGVSDGQWTGYVKTIARGKQGTITPGYSLGYFLIGMRALETIGFVKNVKKGTYKGRSVWLGDWVSPYSLERFLSSPQLQYEAFLKYSMYQKNYIDKNLKKSIGMIENLYDVDKKEYKISLSGIMGLAWQGGNQGAKDWLDGFRKPATSEMFARTNGIF